MKLRRFWLFASVTALAIIGLFSLFELTGWSEGMTLPAPGSASKTSVAVLGVLLLVADVLLPVPSSLVMLAHGAIFDFPMGTALSTLGATGATFVGHRLGRAGSAVVARWVTGEEMVSARALFERWGMTAIVLSRPVPVLAETLAIVAGAAGYGAGRTVLA
ncbi:MAG TPA: VTT domain-containing protein, partial [Polyangiaceae bacterium]